MTSTNFEVDRTGLSKTQFIDIPDADSLSLAANEVVISVDKFALTANNITYGVAGDMLSYWNFFPAKDNWGRIPVWGFGTVLSSNSDGMNVGDR